MISLHQAHQHISMLHSLQPVVQPLDEVLGLVCAEDIFAAANCPTVDSSLKDGFAVISTDIADASPSNPVTLTIIATLAAGDNCQIFRVIPGTAIRIMTGAPIPSGATAVLASEFAQVDDNLVTIIADASAGRNILSKGSDIIKKQMLLAKGNLNNPAHLGFMAAAGLNEARCYPLPKVAVAATGNELIWPGEPVTPGKIAASNMVIAAAELQSLGVKPSTALLRDNLDKLQEEFSSLVRQFDVLITCGGVLDGDKDLTMQAMEQIGIEKIFHRVRIGPGKGACMGRIGNTVVFNLPGGPPSNHVALLLLALPGVRRLMGFKDFLPQKIKIFVPEELSGQEDWTQLIYCKVKYDNGILFSKPLHHMGRLEAMASANALIEIPEGCTMIREGTLADAWLFNKRNI